MKKFRVGDKLYRVCEGYGRSEIESVTISRITPQAVWFERAGLAFGCRTRISLNEAFKEARIPSDAIEAFIEEKRGALREAQRSFDAACSWAAAESKRSA